MLLNPLYDNRTAMRSMRAGPSGERPHAHAWRFWPARSIENLTTPQILNEIDIAIQKIVSMQVFDCFPADLLEDEVPWLALELTDFIKDDLDRSSSRVRIFVAPDL